MQESIPVALARESLTYYLKNKKLLPMPGEIPTLLKRQAGVFVSLKKHGQLRGCIGTFIATQENIAIEIIHNAVSAGVHDPRFWPVELSELNELDISVDVLTPPEKVQGPEELDAKQYGVIVKNKGRTGLLLPDLAGVDSVAQQIDIARQKAGIGCDEPLELYKFSVERYR